jgi:hypothetical protein
MLECSCGGRNPDCFRCSGSGVVDSDHLPAGADLPPGIRRPTIRRQLHGCPECGELCPQVSVHLRRKHGITAATREHGQFFVKERGEWCQCRYCSRCFPAAEYESHLSSSHAKLMRRIERATAASLVEPVTVVASASESLSNPRPQPGSREAMLKFLLRRRPREHSCIKCGKRLAKGYLPIDASEFHATPLKIHQTCLNALPSPFKSLISGPYVHCSSGKATPKKLKRKTSPKLLSKRKKVPPKRSDRDSVAIRMRGSGFVLPPQGQTLKPGSRNPAAPW